MSNAVELSAGKPAHVAPLHLVTAGAVVDLDAAESAVRDLTGGRA